MNSPKKVIAEIISSEAEDYTDILKVIENKRFDYLVIRTSERRAHRYHRHLGRGCVPIKTR